MFPYLWADNATSSSRALGNTVGPHTHKTSQIHICITTVFLQGGFMEHPFWRSAWNTYWVVNSFLIASSSQNFLTFSSNYPLPYVPGNLGSSHVHTWGPRSQMASPGLGTWLTPGWARRREWVQLTPKDDWLVSETDAHQTKRGLLHPTVGTMAVENAGQGERGEEGWLKEKT